MHVEQYIQIILHILNHFTHPCGYRPLVSKMILKSPFFQVIPGLSQCSQWLHRV